MRGTDIDDLCRPRGWSRSRLVREMRLAARRLNKGELPKDESLIRMVRQWANGTRDLSEHHAQILEEVFGFPFSDETSAADTGGDQAAELQARLAGGRQVIDRSLVILLDANLDTLRALDRRLGAEHLLSQTRAHLDQLQHLTTYTAHVPARADLAAAAAETAALAGWQALDLGRPDESWKLHAVGIAAARESGDPQVLAHVTAQQAYALLDVDRPSEAAALIEHAIDSLQGNGSAVLKAWLHAAHAEALAADGDAAACQRALDDASRELERDSGSDPLPYLFLNDAHLTRWRGHCWAQIGEPAAVDDLHRALTAMDPTFIRATAALHCDLAVAYQRRGDRDAADHEAAAARAIALQTGSQRQRRRIERLLKAG